ncbi:hypothetical protein [Cellulomonas sp. Marseille-Q8402]
MTESPESPRPTLPAPDATSRSAPPPEAADPAAPETSEQPAPSALFGRPRRRFGRWVVAAVLVGVLAVGGIGGFAIGRATAPEFSAPFGGERPDGDRMPQPPGDRSGDTEQGSGSASDGSTGSATDDSAATGTSATT